MRNIFTPLFSATVLLGLVACQSSSQDTEQQAEIPPATETPEADKDKEELGTILFFGNSLTAGYGLDEVDDAFPNLIQQKIDSLGYDFRVIKAGLSGETTTAGVNRLPWLLRQPVDILVIELGANDGLRGIDPTETEANLQAMIDTARQKQPGIQIALFGMLVPPNMGSDYSQRFESIYPRLVERNEVEYLPFLLDGVAGNPELNLPDGIHPTVEGHKIVANNVWPLMEKMILQSREE